MSKSVDELYKLKVREESKNFEIGKQMLGIAKNDLEKSVAYKKMGDASGKLGNYKEAINYLNSAEIFAEKINSIEEQILINTILSQVYGRIGMTNKADESLNKSEKLAIQLNNPRYLSVYYAYKMANIMDKEDYRQAIYYALKIITYLEEEQKTNPSNSKNTIISLNEYYDGLAFMYMKCNEWDKAKESIEKADYYKNLLPKTDFNINNFYYHSRALLLAKQNKTVESKKYYDSAYEKAVNRNNIIHRINILEERFATKIDRGTEKYEEIAEQILDLKRLQAHEQSKANVLLDENNKKKVFRFQERTNSILIFSSIIVMISLGGILYLKQRNKKLKSRFLKIMNDLEVKKSQTKNSILENTAVTEKTNNNSDDEQKEDAERDRIWVKQLEQLEEKLFFTSKNISVTQLAAMLKITPRNLSYILKKYKNDNFYNYLNTLRIDYCILLLKENPKYRNYKLNVISEMCGYNSYSQFTINFKSKTGISPSQFIALLQDDQVDVSSEN